MADEGIDKEQKVDIENNITLEPGVWMKNAVAFFKAENKQHNMAISLTSRQNWISFFGVTKVKWLTCPLQNVLAEEKLLHQRSSPPQGEYAAGELLI